MAPPRRKARPAPRPNLPYSLVLTTHCSLTHESLLTLTTHYSPLTTTHSLLTTVRRTTTTYYYDVLLSRLVKHLDPNHLLLIGSEGATPFKDAGIDVMQDPTTMPLY